MGFEYILLALFISYISGEIVIYPHSHKIPFTLRKLSRKTIKPSLNLLGMKLRAYVPVDNSHTLTNQLGLPFFREKYGVQKIGLLWFLWLRFVSDKNQVVSMKTAKDLKTVLVN
jgi:hypothetical protein